MTGLTEVVAFVAVTDLDLAEEFYGSVLGLPLRDERPFALTATIGSTLLRITEVETLEPAPYTVLGFNVANIGETVDQLAEREVIFNRYEGMTQDPRGVWTSPSGARVAWFLDPDGNNLSLTQHPDRGREQRRPAAERDAEIYGQLGEDSELHGLADYAARLPRPELD